MASLGNTRAFCQLVAPMSGKSSVYPRLTDPADDPVSTNRSHSKIMEEHDHSGILPLNVDLNSGDVDNVSTLQALKLVKSRPRKYVDWESDVQGWPYFILVRGAFHGTLVKLDASGHVLGRAVECDLFYPDSNISRKHAKIEFDCSGQAWLTDLTSTNGTYVNGARLPSGVPTLLGDGDYVMFGSSMVAKFVRLTPNEQKLQNELFERTARDREIKSTSKQPSLESSASSLILKGFSEGQGAAVAFMELEGITLFKERLGAAASEDAARRVMDWLKSALRPNDIMIRHDEAILGFATIICSATWAKDWGWSLRNRVCGRVIRWEDSQWRVDAKMGVVFVSRDHPKPINVIIDIANQALNQARSELGKRVVCLTLDDEDQNA